MAAIAPAVMASKQSRDGEGLEGAISSYWDIEPRAYFLVPFLAAAALLLIDGALSYLSSNKDIYGRRGYNIALSGFLVMLTLFNKDDSPFLHYVGAYGFFILFVLVIAATTALAWFGDPIDSSTTPRGEAAVAAARVSAVFLALLALTLVAWWPLNLVTLFFFQIFALVNFTLFYVQGFFYAFPYRRYVLPWTGPNIVLRWLGLIGPDRS